MYKYVAVDMYATLFTFVGRKLINIANRHESTREGRAEPLSSLKMRGTYLWWEGSGEGPDM